jgi:hemerythrin
VANLIELTDDLLTGVAEMDEQHRVLVSLLNETYELLRAHDREGATRHLLEGVVGYVDAHFAAEEAFLKEAGFPEQEAHRQIHETFKRQALQWVEEARSGDEAALREIIAMIWAWLARHIGVRDRAYGEFCRALGTPSSR